LASLHDSLPEPILLLALRLKQLMRVSNGCERLQNATSAAKLRAGVTAPCLSSSVRKLRIWTHAVALCQWICVLPLSMFPDLPRMRLHGEMRTEAMS
jgi:hypothetical protein